MTHRITFLERRADITLDHFHTHWAGDHAEIILRMPGLVAYAQNHVIESWTNGGGTFKPAGVVETWFSSAQIASVGDVAPELFTELLADEEAFLGGLAGFQVFDAPAPASSACWRIWLVAPLEPKELEAAVALLDTQTQPAISLLRRDPDAAKMSRPRLATLDPMPEAVLHAEFGDEEQTRRAFAALEKSFAARSVPPGSWLLLTKGLKKR